MTAWSRRWIRSASLTLLACIAMIPAAGAQTLEECLAIARTHAPSIRVAEADVARADQAIRVARAALSPTLHLGASFVQSTESPRTVFSIPGTPGGPLAIKVGSATVLDVRTEARMPLYNGGRDKDLVKAAEAAKVGREHSREQADAELTLRVSRAFYQALSAERLESAAQEALQAALIYRSTSAARVKAGVSPRLDSLQAQVDVSRRTSGYVRAREAVLISHAELEREIGATLDTTRALVEPGAPTEIPESAGAIEQALHSRPELAAADQALLENSWRLEAARAASKPEVNLNGTAQYLGPNRFEDWWDVNDPGLKTYRFFAGFGLSMPLYDGGLIRARVGEVAADRFALTARREDLALSIRREVEQALSDARLAFTLWQSDSSNVSASREALRTAAAGYKGGVATGTDVRTAEAALADARAQEAQSLMDFWIARAALDRATGTVVKEGR
jgi:outer membrane protein